MKRLCVVLLMILLGCGKDKGNDSSIHSLQETNAIIEMYYQMGRGFKGTPISEDA